MFSMSQVGSDAAVAGLMGAGVGYVYGSLAHADKKVAAMVFAVFFAVHRVCKFLPYMTITNPSDKPSYKALGQQQKKVVNSAYRNRIGTVYSATAALNLAVSTLAFRHFGLIANRGTAVMSFACLVQVLDLFPAVRALKLQAGITLSALRTGSSAPK